MVRIFDVDFSDSRYLEQQENYETADVRTRIIQQLSRIDEIIPDEQELTQLRLMNDRYPEYDFSEHSLLTELNNHDAATFNMVREQINQERMQRMQGIQITLDEGIHQNKELLAFGINRNLYEADFALQSVAIFQDTVLEFHSLEDLLRACKIPSEYSFPLDFSVNQRMPFLFCPCCGEIKEYYQDPLSQVKQPYDLCWKCQNNNSGISQLSRVKPRGL